MEVFTDKLILLGFCMFLLLGVNEAREPVIAFLFAVTAGALGNYIEEKRQRYMLYALFFASALVWPMVLLLFPVVLYDMLRRKDFLWTAPFFVLTLLRLPVTAKCAVYWASTSALCVWLSYTTEQKKRLKDALIRIRDSGAELNLTLMEKNKVLLEKQDSEIYLATLKERNRIAREIHDNVGHMLSRSLLMTGALLTKERQGETYDLLLQMKDTLNSAMDSIRQSVHNLHEDSVDLKQAAYEIAESAGLDFEVKLDFDMSGAVPGRVKYCLIAVAKEAVSNAVKHSNGKKMVICFREHPGFYRLSVEDNGTNAKVRPEKGIGLQNMRERADSLGGTILFRAQDGFAVFMTIPKTEEILCE